MLGMLEEKGFSFTDEERYAQIAVVNTCCFINDAKEESIHTLLEMARLKESGRLKVLIAAGCLAQRYREEIQKEIPQVDAIVGTAATDCICEAIEEALAGKGRNHYRDLRERPSEAGRRVLTTGGHFAYLKIAEGCDKHCTYCIIPKVRGGYRSIPMESLLAEAARLAEQGVKELILVAQETTLYGVDLYGAKRLPKLLEDLAKIGGIRWIRILYCYPEEITRELIDVIEKEPKICHYLDIPVQHASDAVLKRMGRRTDRAELSRIVTLLREKIPDICIRTTLITGFPGETRADHETLLTFVREMRFDRLGVFPYSQEEGTPAAVWPEQIEEEVKERRREEIMALQQEIAFEKARGMTGRVLEVMIEGKVADEETYVARTYRDAPEVDGYLFVDTAAQLMTGDLVEVRVVGSNEYDLIGEMEA
jgi:ribosomal protein S12 methylthiotransferase